MIQLKQVFARIYEIVNFREHTYTSLNFFFRLALNELSSTFLIYNVNNDILKEVSMFGF